MLHEMCDSVIHKYIYLFALLNKIPSLIGESRMTWKIQVKSFTTLFNNFLFFIFKLTSSYHQGFFKNCINMYFGIVGAIKSIIYIPVTFYRASINYQTAASPWKL